MKKVLLCGVMAFVSWASGTAWASETYRLRVDGLACPFCAYGVEKKLNNSQGVEAIDIRINEGVVLVTVTENAGFDRARAERIVQEAGFTLSGFEKLSRVE